MLGTVTICKDYQELNNFITMRPSLGFTNECKVIVIDDVQINHLDYVNGSILLPTPSSVIDFMDTNDIYSFNNNYLNYLSNNQEVNDFILVLLSCIIREKDLILFYNEQPIPFIQILINYLNSYGLILDSWKYNTQSIDSNYIYNIINRLLNLGYISQKHIDRIYPQCNQNSIFKQCGGY